MRGQRSVGAGMVTSLPFHESVPGLIPSLDVTGGLSLLIFLTLLREVCPFGKTILYFRHQSTSGVRKSVLLSEGLSWPALISSGSSVPWLFSSIRGCLHETGRRISRLAPATETKSDRSEFIARPVSCKHITRNVWWPIRTHAGQSSSRSHVNTP